MAYVTLQQADDYFEVHLSSKPWDALDDPVKQAAINAATTTIDNQRLQGRKADPDQELEFPRRIRGVAQEDVPERVEDACCELALHLATVQNSARAQAQRDGVTSIKAGDASETYNVSAVELAMRGALPVTVANLLRPYLSGTGAIT